MGPGRRGSSQGVLGWTITCGGGWIGLGHAWQWGREQLVDDAGSVSHRARANGFHDTASCLLLGLVSLPLGELQTDDRGSFAFACFLEPHERLVSFFAIRLRALGFGDDVLSGLDEIGRDANEPDGEVADRGDGCGERHRERDDGGGHGYLRRLGNVASVSTIAKTIARIT